MNLRCSLLVVIQVVFMNLRCLLLVVISSVLLGCQSQKGLDAQNEKEENLSAFCPKDGNCTFEVLTNSSLNLQTDGIGQLYPQVKKGNKTVLKFEYKRSVDPRIADGGYTEIVYAEIDPKTKDLNLSDEQLTSANVVFGRLCFCRGQAGYFRIDQGALVISTAKDRSKTYAFTFTTDKVPQRLTHFSVTR
jgi:hypothetical protein